MFWADELAARLSGPQVLNDSKTPSGTVHVGSLRGPVINDVIVRAIRAAGMEAVLLVADAAAPAPQCRRVESLVVLADDLLTGGRS